MLQHITLRARRATLLAAALALGLASVVPAFLPSLVSAAPAVTERELQSTSAIPGDSGVTLTWVFNTPNNGATNVDHIQIEFCDSPLSACTNADGDSGTPDTTGSSIDNIPFVPATPTATLSGPWASTANSATRGNGLGGGANNQITIDKTTVDDNSNKTGLNISIGGFTNDNIANRSYYTRLRMYSDAGTTLVYEGVFAQSTSQTLTVNARVQERLDFCVGSTAVDDAAGNPTPTLGDCRDVTGSTVDIGNVENGAVNISPVDTTNGGSNTNGVAMVRTNAVNGVVVDYKAVQNSASGSLKVTGATCGSTAYSGGSATDQCFNSRGLTQGTMVPGNEAFGMTIGGVNCISTTAYTCSYSASTNNLVPDAEYNGVGAGTFVTEGDQVFGTTTTGFAWDDTGTAARIASSATSTVKVVDDEALILKFAATAGVTTPTGSYTVQADYIATATF